MRPEARQLDLKRMEREIGDVTKESGKIVIEAFYSGRVKVTKKKDLSPLTATDIESQKLIIDALAVKYPEIQPIAEEQLSDKNVKVKGGLYFAIDPLDGTSNFACHIPLFSISIALYSGNTPLLGVLYNPINDELFSAVVGQGAYLNDERIRPKDYEPLEDSFVNINVAKLDPDIVNRINVQIARRVKKVRNLGCVSLEMAWVACGRIHGLINHYLSIWDIGACGIILEEVGGVWSTLSGRKPAFPSLQKFPICAAGTPRLHKELLERIGATADR